MGLWMVVSTLSVSLGAPLLVSSALAQEPPESPIQDTAQQQALLRQRAIEEFNASYNTAAEHLKNKQFTEAGQTISQSIAALDMRQSALGDDEYRTMREKAQKLQDDITNARDADMLLAQQKAEQAAAEARRKAEEAELRERERRIDESLDRVRQLQLEQKYDEALQVVNEILFLDELNPSALALRDIIMTTMLYRDYARASKLKEMGIGDLEVENQWALVTPRKNLNGPGPRSSNALVTYPEDWPQVSARRGGVSGFQESEADATVRQRLSQTRVPIDFNNNSLEQVVAFMEQVTGLDIYVDYKALNNVGIDRTAEVSLRLQDVPMDTALSRVLEQLGEGTDRPQWAIQDGMLTVSSDQALRARTVLLVYDIRDLLFQVPNFDNAPELDLESALNQAQNQGGGAGGGGGGGFGGGGGGGGGGGMGGGGGGAIFGEPGDDPERLTREELVAQIVSIIQENVDPEGWRDLGGDTGSIQELNGNLIIRNTANNHRDIEGLLSQLREIRALQINVESRFLTVSTDWFEQIGVDLDLYFNTNDDMWQAAQSVDPNFHLSDFFNPDGSLRDPVFFGSPEQVFDNDPITPFNAVPTGAYIGTPNGATPIEGVNYALGPVGAPIRARDGFAPIGVNQNSLGLIDALAEFDPASFAGIAAANPALTIGIQFLDDIQVDLLIEATQADRRSVTLTAPRLTFFNGQRSWVAVTTQQAYVASLTAVTGDASGAFQPNIATLQTGFVLDVEGVISADRRYVTLTVIFDFAEFLGFRQSSAAEFSGAAGGGGTGGGNAEDFTGSVELPVIRVSQIRTTVSVPDKGTVLLGGQRTITEIELETGVPVLSKIPFVNRFFTNRVTSKTEQTLLILIRPEIIIQQENEDLLFPGLGDNLGGAASYVR
jgi:type II secretory pathway component GspD/PulD (secretin)